MPPSLVRNTLRRSHNQNTPYVFLPRHFKSSPTSSSSKRESQALRNINPVAAQQVALDNALVPPEKRLKIEKCNARIELSKPHREKTYQVTLDALKLFTCYLAVLITAEVPEVLLNQDFVEPPSEEDLVPFIQELGYSGKCDMLFAIHTDQMHQPWRTFAAIINRCISGKTTRLDRLRESRAQILWGMYNKKNVDYVALLWEDFMYQGGNREISSARKEHMPYPRFTKVIINHFISNDKTISMRNMINIHIIYDDSLLDIKDSKAYKTYYDFATGKATLEKERKYKKVASPSRKLSPVLEEEPTVKPKKAKKPAKKSTTIPTTGVVIRDTPGVSVSKKKAPAKKSNKDSHTLHPSSLGDGVGSQPKVHDEFEDKTTGIDEGTGDSNDDDNDDDSNDVSKGDDDKPNSDDDDGNDAQDSKRTDSDEKENPNLNMKVDEEEETQKDERSLDATHEDLLKKKSDEQVIKDARVPRYIFTDD
ncbi:hypothetical protein Tco_1074930 [Tanacetum coccineum]